MNNLKPFAPDRNRVYMQNKMESNQVNTKGNLAQPPRYAQKLLTLFLRDALQEEVMGDLEEKYLATIARASVRQAKLNYWYQVLHYLRPFAIKALMSTPLYYHGMITNYSKITIRNLGKQKLYASLNIGGLAVGIATFLMIALFVQYEFSYDRFLPNQQRIYRIYQKQAGNLYMGTELFGVTPIQLAGVLREEFPEIEYSTVVHHAESLLQPDYEIFLEYGLAVDEHFFEVFPFEMISGNAQQAIADVHSIVLTQKLATKLFGTDNPIGKVIRFDKESTRQVTGVMKDPPHHSSLHFDFIVNIKGNESRREEMTRPTWKNNSCFTFFVLRTGSDVNDVEKKFPAMIDRYHDEEAYSSYPFKDTYYTQPLTDMHLFSGINFDIGEKGNKTYVYVYGGIAVIVLLLACINYMNLAIARSINRAREVGLRKVVGAVRRQLVFQFLGESTFISIISMLLGVGIALAILPFFGNLVDRPLTIDFDDNAWLVPGLLITALCVGLAAGSYPALVISSLRPARVIKGSSAGLGNRFTMQRILTVVQFSISVVLITVTVVIYRQMQYIKSKDLGFSKDHVLVVNVRDRSLKKEFETLQHEWLKNPHILSVAAAEQLPSNIMSSTVINDDDQDKSNDLNIYNSRITPDYFKVFGIKLLTGRTFIPGMKSEFDRKVIVNESAAKALGWTPSEAIGKTFQNDQAESTIIGVVRDFNMHNLHLAVAPVMFTLYNPTSGIFALKITPDDIEQTVAFVERSVKPFTSYPFSYVFLEDNFNQMYKEDVRVGKTFGFFTGLAMLIAAVGLFGLAAFISGQRTREVGIRKVLGASVESIVLLLSADFLKLVILSFFISIPFAWFAADRWLQSFAYRTELSWWIFLIAGTLAVLAAKIAIAYQSVTASLTNPVQSLRSVG